MASGPEGPYEAKVLLPECPVGRVGCFSGALRGEGACFVARSEHPGGALGLTYRRYLSMRGPIIEKKGLRGWSSRRSRLPALWFRCPGVPREAMRLSSSLVRMRDRARVVLPCVRDEGRAMRLISSHLGTRSRSGGKAEVLKGPRGRKQVRRLTGG